VPISVSCPACGQKHKAPDRAAGRTLKCRSCGGPILVPDAALDPGDFLLGREEEPTPSAPEQSGDVEEPEETPETPTPPSQPSVRPARTRPDRADQLPLTTDDQPFWRRHLHWLLVLAMIPLATSLLSERGHKELVERLTKAVREAPPNVQVRIAQAMESNATLGDVIALLPEQRLEGAWLPQTTFAHWGMAAMMAVLFLIFFMFLASDGSAEPWHVLAVGVFTATVGVGFLLVVQGIASWTEGRIVVGRSVLVLIFYIFKFIAFSYSAASDPENGFLLSFVGFTAGVGFLEELIKAVPIFWYPQESRGKDWRGLFIWGLASGAGFGIAEGILYSSRYYNGVSGPETYLVRFLSCVALHAIWSGSVGITLYLRRDTFINLGSWSEWIAPTLVVIGVPMVLHGLYDTCLKRDLNVVALLIAVVSFAWLAFLMSRLYGTDDAAATQAMLAEYKRRRKAV
jgi:RsiW-degrading membrane proteinase PrsW (M82 family)